MEKSDSQYDVVVVGGGSGGYAAARTAVSQGLKTVVLDGARELGGLCILRGCMPTKALLYSTEVLHLCQNAEEWGVRTGSVEFDYSRIMARKKKLIDEFASYRKEQLESGKFDLIRSNGRFIDSHRLEVDGGKTVSGRWIILATGSKVSDPPLASLKEVGYWTSDEALEAPSLPKSLIVLGGGAIAVEAAQFYQRLGVEVTLIQRSSHLIKEFDPEAGETLVKVFQEEGMKVFTDTHLEDAGKDGQRKWVQFKHQNKWQRCEADEILYALGRSPNTASLGLDQAGVRVKRDGTIEIAETLATSQPHIFAVGDCASEQKVVHEAVIQGETAIYNILHPQSPRKLDSRLNMSIVFTEPQVAMVGLSEQEARKQGLEIISGSYPFFDHGKSMIMNIRHGFVKMISSRETGEILGAACMSPLAGELLHEVVVAMYSRLTVKQFMEIPHYHPTLAEIWTYPADDVLSNGGW